MTMSIKSDIFPLVIKWDEEKDRWLILRRGISFNDIAEKIIEGEYLDILENPRKPNQDIFLIAIKGYVWVVPFVIDKDEAIFLKTAYPSRKFNKIYGGRHEKED